MKKAIIQKAKKEYKTLFETYVNTILDYALKNRGNVEIIDIMRQKRANHEELKNTDYVGRVEKYNRFVEKYIKSEFAKDCTNTYTQAIPRGN